MTGMTCGSEVKTEPEQARFRLPKEPRSARHNAREVQTLKEQTRHANERQKAENAAPPCFR